MQNDLAEFFVLFNLLEAPDHSPYHAPDGDTTE